MKRRSNVRAAAVASAPPTTDVAPKAPAKSAEAKVLANKGKAKASEVQAKGKTEFSRFVQSLRTAGVPEEILPTTMPKAMVAIVCCDDVQT